MKKHIIVALIACTAFAHSCNYARKQAPAGAPPAVDSTYKELVDVFNSYSNNPEASDSDLVRLKENAASSYGKLRAAYFIAKANYLRFKNVKDSSVYFAKMGLQAGIEDTPATKSMMIQAYKLIALGYAGSSEHDSALAYAYKDIAISEKYKKNVADAYNTIAVVASAQGDTALMVQYLEKAISIEEDPGAKGTMYSNISDIYQQQKNYHAQYEALRKGERLLMLNKEDEVYLGIAWVNLAACFTNLKELDSAGLYAAKAMAMNRRHQNEVSDDYIIYGNVAAERKEQSAAAQLYKRALEMSAAEGAEINKIIAARKLGEAYSALGQWQQAALYADSSAKMSEVFYKSQLAQNIAKLETDVRIRSRESRISFLNTQEEDGRKMIRMQQLGIAGLLLLMAMLFALIYNSRKRMRLNAAKTKAEAETKQIQLEQRLLRTQMEPHFIFNSLAVMQSFIRDGDEEKSLKYLSTFAKLLRESLEHSREAVVPLSKELASLENYLHLQQMRFEGLFGYTVACPAALLQDESVLIPPMLLQPFVENSIQHGFKGMQSGGRIDISIAMQDKKLLISIADNGAGLSHAEAGSAIHKSLSTRITRERLGMLSADTGVQSDLQIMPRLPKGTIVEMAVPAV